MNEPSKEPSYLIDELQQTKPFQERFIEGVQHEPFLAAGLTGLVTILGIGAYKWRTRTSPVSLYLIHLRMAAQGTAVGCLSLGMIYHMVKDYWKPSE